MRTLLDMVKFQPLAPLSMTIFGNRVIADVRSYNEVMLE
jgi:hypothetical protein